MIITGTRTMQITAQTYPAASPAFTQRNARPNLLQLPLDARTPPTGQTAEPEAPVRPAPELRQPPAIPDPASRDAFLRATVSASLLGPEAPAETATPAPNRADSDLQPSGMVPAEASAAFDQLAEQLSPLLMALAGKQNPAMDTATARELLRQGFQSALANAATANEPAEAVEAAASTARQEAMERLAIRDFEAIQRDFAPQYGRVPAAAASPLNLVA